MNPRGSSPNLRQLRTGLVNPRRIESEPEATSDRLGESKGESSPNLGQLRTGLVNPRRIESEPKATSDRFGEPKGIESELEATSDRFGESKGNRVRTLRTFSENVRKPVQKTKIFAKTAFFKKENFTKAVGVRL